MYVTNIIFLLIFLTFLSRSSLWIYYWIWIAISSLWYHLHYPIQRLSVYLLPSEMVVMVTHVCCCHFGCNSDQATDADV